MEEYLKRCRINLSDESKLIQDSIRLEAQLSLTLTKLKSCLLGGDCDSRWESLFLPEAKAQVVVLQSFTGLQQLSSSSDTALCVVPLTLQHMGPFSSSWIFSNSTHKLCIRFANGGPHKNWLHIAVNTRLLFSNYEQRDFNLSGFVLSRPSGLWGTGPAEPHLASRCWFTLLLLRERRSPWQRRQHSSSIKKTLHRSYLLTGRTVVATILKSNIVKGCHYFAIAS